MKRTNGILFLILLIGSLGNVCAQDLKFKIEGTIQDICDDEYIEGIDVQLVDTIAGDTLFTITDSNGFYEFYKSDKGDFLLSEDRVYSIIVKGKGLIYSNQECWYLDSKGYETTYNMKESTAFVHDFKLLSASCDCPNIRLPRLFFEKTNRFDSSESCNPHDTLVYLYLILLENPNIIIEIAGHCTDYESNDKNQIYSQKRADLVKSYLTEKGIEEERMIAIGYGAEKPIVSEEEMKLLSEEERKKAHLKNNRVIFRVISWDYVPKEFQTDNE